MPGFCSLLNWIRVGHAIDARLVVVVACSDDIVCDHQRDQQYELQQADALSYAIPQIESSRLGGSDLEPDAPEDGAERRGMQPEVQEQQRRLCVALRPRCQQAAVCVSRPVIRPNPVELGRVCDQESLSAETAG